MRFLALEKTLWLAAVAAVIFGIYEHSLLSAGSATLWGAFALLFGIIIATSMRVAHHAEVLAQRLGEPYGTMILTISAVVVEVVMLVILMSGSHSPTLARDTVYSAVMLDVNGILGLAAIMGGMRHGEQKYNLDSAHSYIGMLLVAIGIAMFIPEFIQPAAWQAYSVFTIAITVLLYFAFLRIQTIEHRYFFEFAYDVPDEEEHHGGSGTVIHVGLLIVSVVVIGVLAEFLSAFLEHGMQGSRLPLALPAVLVALVSASPEILTALRAARADRMQTAINIALGASLATVLLTIPVIEGYALITGDRIEMAMTPLQTAMVALTLFAALISLHDGETNVLEGAVHFSLFLTFVALMFVA
jgi:Ca2+:H+ antiporter